VRSTSCMLLFLSKGYFRSTNCLRELRATISEQRPFVLVHETDEGKGGLPLEASKAECPVEMREHLFMHAPPPASSGSGPLALAEPRQVVAWHRIKDFQLLSLRLICSKILHTTPYYINVAESALEASGRASMRNSARSAQIKQLSKKNSNTVSFRVADLDGLFVPGEAVSLNLSCEHLAQAERVYYSQRNPGAYDFGKEMVRAIIGLTLVDEEESGLRFQAVGTDERAAYAPADRVVHVKHGLGVVKGWVAGGRLEVLFDDNP